jgi:hypothetical protein
MNKLNNSTNLGENYYANCSGINISLKSGLAVSVVKEIILLLVYFIPVLTEKDKTSLGFITYKPLSFAGNQTYFGLSDKELSILISGPDLIIPPIMNCESMNVVNYER